VLQMEAEAIRALIPRLGNGFIQAVEILQSCRGRVVLTGMGKSGFIAKKVAATLASTGTPALFLHPAEGVHGDLGMVVPGDVVLAVSNSGETGEMEQHAITSLLIVDEAGRPEGVIHLHDLLRAGVV
jgi:arabinose-5-phosphate isomerase